MQYGRVGALPRAVATASQDEKALLHHRGSVRSVRHRVGYPVPLRLLVQRLLVQLRFNCVRIRLLGFFCLA